MNALDVLPTLGSQQPGQVIARMPAEISAPNLEVMGIIRHQRVKSLSDLPQATGGIFRWRDVCRALRLDFVGISCRRFCTARTTKNFLANRGAFGYKFLKQSRTSVVSLK